MVCGALSDDHLIQCNVVTGTLNAKKYQDETLESGVRSPLESLANSQWFHSSLLHEWDRMLFLERMYQAVCEPTWLEHGASR